MQQFLCHVALRGGKPFATFQDGSQLQVLQNVKEESVKGESNDLGPGAAHSWLEAAGKLFQSLIVLGQKMNLYHKQFIYLFSCHTE